MIESFLAGVPLLASLPPSALRLLGEVLQVVTYDEGDLLVREGDAGERFRIILEGEVEVVKALATPGARTLRILGPGQFFGEVGLLLADGRRSASVRARSSVRLLEMGRADFEALLAQHPTLGLAILRAIVARMRQNDDALIQELQQNNDQMRQAYADLQAAQEQLLEKQRLEVELQTAYRIQQRFLPTTLPDVPGWQVEAYWQPAQVVGGDFYDFLSLPGGRLGIVVGDVAGKGVPAALVMATTHTMLRTAAELFASPAAILQRVNNLLVAQVDPLMFVTCCYCVLDPATRQLTFANAGHLPPYRQTAHEVMELRARGLPLGLMPGVEYQETEALLHPGDSLIFYSDGLIEAHSPQGEMFGFPRFCDALLRYGNTPNLIANLRGQLRAFTGDDGSPEDDVTLIALRQLDRTEVDRTNA
jgi:serine phosphatase RsbU (regulator of sigma subunit)